MKRFAKIRLSISRFGTARISSISAELACQIMLILAAVFTTSCSISNGERTCGLPLNYNIFCFYYNWYGNEGFDNKLVHWAHPVLPESAGLIDSGYIFGENNNIASNFFPFWDYTAITIRKLSGNIWRWFPKHASVCLP